MRASSRKLPRGFTLIEVMVSLGVLSLILLATVSALRTFANTQVSLDKLSGRVDEVRTISAFLRDMLSGAVGGVSESGGLTLGGGSTDLAYFEGDSRSIEWKAPALFGEESGGTLLMRLEKKGDALMLYWQEPPPPQDKVDWKNARSRILLQPIENFHVDFRASLDEEWISREWDEPGAPALVRLTIKAENRHWPDLIMQVQR